MQTPDTQGWEFNMELTKIYSCYGNSDKITSTTLHDGLPETNTYITTGDENLKVATYIL